MSDNRVTRDVYHREGAGLHFTAEQLAQFGPIHDRIVVKCDPVPERVGSIYKPERRNRKDLTRSGVIVVMGPGEYTQPEKYCDCFDPETGVVHDGCFKCLGNYKLPAQRREMECKIGDRIAYEHSEDQEITVDGKRYALLPHEEQEPACVIDAACVVG